SRMNISTLIPTRRSSDLWSETYSVLTEMLKIAECRGTDATGYAALMQPYDHRGNVKVITEKAAIRSTHFVESSAWRRLRHQRSRSEEHTSELQSLAYLVC